MKIKFLLILGLCAACGQKEISLQNDHLQLRWKKTSDGWHVEYLKGKLDQVWVSVGKPAGKYTLLYSAGKPDSTSIVFKTDTGVEFPEKVYKYQQDYWHKATEPVSLNTAGQAIDFFPSEGTLHADGTAVFETENEWARVTAQWKLDPRFPTDIVIKQTCVVRKAGYYSLQSPAPVTIDSTETAWVTVPGYFQGRGVQPDFIDAYAYGQGAPALPVVYRERCVSTLASIIDTKAGLSLSAIPAPGLARDPWEKDHNTHEQWRVGMSHKNRAGQLAPSVFYPVLGEAPSRLDAGDSIVFEVRYSVQPGNWFKSLNHAVYDIYRFREGLAMRSNKQSLTSRIEAMHHYLTNARTSLWNIESFEGLKIGGQSYLGGVVGSQGDAMKNSDYGAMWMLARATADPALHKNVLPYALNFKLTQQQTAPGFFQGAAIGQYYLAKRKKFVEEWGEFVEPVSLTYYTMLDMGNILLFEPDNQLLRDRLRLGADLLLTWQKTDGSWEVAYDRKNEQPLFTDIKDLRPTFYGLLVAYRILKDEKYLKAAEKGADWLVRYGVDKGYFIGVCGDARYAPDFATAQTAQALLDLYDITKQEKYRDAAIAAARLYTTSIYTHPIPSRARKMVNGVDREDWEIAQAGVGFEHGGNMGSAQRNGPILLASHAGLFVRMFSLTGDSLFIDMARAGAIGRDAFVDKATSVASYYWIAVNKGAGPYPHHAWWQIGWITDYLLAEAQLRSGGSIIFPRGFVTPKVGPHQSYGFEPGQVFGDKAELAIREQLFHTEDPNIEIITARVPSGKRWFAIALNDVAQPRQHDLKIDAQRAGGRIKAITELMENKPLGTASTVKMTLPAYGIKVYAIDLE